MWWSYREGRREWRWPFLTCLWTLAVTILWHRSISLIIGERGGREGGWPSPVVDIILWHRSISLIIGERGGREGGREGEREGGREGGLLRLWTLFCGTGLSH